MNASGGGGKESERIGGQLRRAFDGEAWHGPAVQELLADVDAAGAAARPVASAHSIWELVLHINAWHTTARLSLAGKPLQLSDEEDWRPVEDTSEQAWAAARATLEKGHRALLESVGDLSDEDLEKVVPGKSYSIYFLLHGIVQHDLYHAGQIALLKKEAPPGPQGK